ncbi:respiratory chain complex I subunit 1 family protein [Phosphitispora fastidiosa]|uniref:respiratory chain complex I subunit 1 family protein n=1 Tax=Phosphitispora fastidiosa TaxID=2837202 RepID=UPI001E386789|nr:NADH-quinone oxidoreductase subunit H [Phosphitispora fastidiosa]MBU7006519.1 formate hydrogenlyase subunit 4 [Phosphitispora fastidiosa]
MTEALAASLLQVIIIVLAAPLVSGIIMKFKAFFQTRRGPGIFQPYLDLYKFMQKESVISEHASWIFRVTPYIYFGALLAAAMLMPTISTSGLLSYTGDAILVIYLFALGRFFLTLAGLDAGSAFGGMASSREMAVSSVAEPALMLSLFTMAINGGTTNLTGIISGVNNAGLAAFTPAHILTFGAIYIVALAETGRIPVDNPDTHLELTMIHEGMLLEYSGKPLAILTLGASVKQLLIFTLLANLFFPWGIAAGTGIGALAIALLAYLGKVLLIGLTIAVIETSFTKMRLFKVPELLMGSFLLAFLGLISKFLFGGS